jgi:hypothetical protein
LHILFKKTLNIIKIINYFCIIFDIIIDDGSHNPADIITSLENLWPNLAPDGYYCIEDLGVCRDKKYPDAYRVCWQNYFNNFLTFNIGENKFLDNIDCIMLYKELTVLHKKEKE